MKNPEVDEFVKTRVLTGLQPVAERIRALMLECAPQAEERISYGLPCYVGQRIFALFSPNPKAINFSFTRGVQFKDTYNLLRGSGVSTRHVKIRNLAEINEAALRDYIRQALEFDAK